MKKSGKRIISLGFVVVLTIFLLTLEFSLRIVGSFSPAANRYIHGLLQRNPVLDGFLCAFFMVSGCYIAYVKFPEQKTTGGRVICIISLLVFLVFMLIGFLQIHRIIKVP